MLLKFLLLVGVVFWRSVVQVGAHPVFKRLNNVAARIVITWLVLPSAQGSLEIYKLNSIIRDFWHFLVFGG